MSFLEETLSNEFSAKAHSKELSDGTKLEFVDTGILRIKPNSSASHRVVISCGIHGNETAPIEMVEQLFQEILTGTLSVRAELLFIIGNPPAANKAERFIEENLNRLFSGKHKHSSTQEANRASLLEQVVGDFFNEGSEPRLHYDLHTAIRGSEFEQFAVYPFLHERKWSKPQIAFLERCGLGAVLLSNQPAGTFSYFTSHSFNAHSFTVELGKVHKFGDNDMANFEPAMEGLRGLIAGQENFEAQPESIQTFAVVEEVIKRSSEFKLHFLPDAKNFTVFPKDSILASDRHYQYRTQQDGERFVFPIVNVPIGQRAMLVVAPTEI
jgi:succinylglutamate desuccinylase